MYLDFAQNKRQFIASPGLLECRSRGVAVIQGDALNVADRIKPNATRDLEDIAHGSPHPIFLEVGSDLGQIVARPNHHVMRELSEQHQHLLGRELVLVAMHQVQALFVIAVLSFGPTSALIVSMHGREQNGVGENGRRHRLVTQFKESRIRER